MLSIAVFGMVAIYGVIVLLIVWAIFTYNRLIRLRNRIQMSWSQIDVELRRRYDLIPNLVETVKGYAAHERQTFEEVTKARQAGIDASTVKEQGEAENMITGALRRLFALAEAYPQLRASENFIQLQSDLAGIESKVAEARQSYNGSVVTYDNLRRSFPANLIASGFKFEPRDYFEIEEEEARGPVKVQF